MDQSPDKPTAPPRPETPREHRQPKRQQPPSSAKHPPATGPPWLGSVHHCSQIDLQWLMVAVIMAASAATFFGRRAMFSVVVAAMATLCSFIIVALAMKLIAPRWPRGSILHALVLGILFGVTLPLTHNPTLPLFGGAIVGVVAHVVGRAKMFRIQPVAVVMVIIWLTSLWSQSQGLLAALEPVEAVLRPARVVIGDVANRSAVLSTEPWWSSIDGWAGDWQRLDTAGNEQPAFDATYRRDPYRVLTESQWMILEHPGKLAEMLSMGDLCRLEEILLGCVPGPLGATSRLLLIVLGLYMLYRRLSYWPMVVAALVAATAMTVCLPVQIDAQWTIAGVAMAAMGPAEAVTFVAYCLLVSPLALIVLILAPGYGPTSTTGRVVFGLMVGIVVVLAQWYLMSANAAYLSLVIAGLFNRPLDLLQRSAFVHAGSR